MNGSMHELHIRMQCIITFQSTKKSHAIHGYFLQVKYLCSIKVLLLPISRVAKYHLKITSICRKKLIKYYNLNRLLD